MSSYRNHRVIIASLFLPTTAVLGPETIDLPIPVPKKEPANTHTRQSSAANVPLKSIVDDLKDKTTSRLGTPAARSPAIEAVNPFTKLTRFAIDDPPAHSTSTDPSANTARAIRRKHSRSSSRRATSTARTPLSPSTISTTSSTSHDPTLSISESWHIEPNPNCNGGLKNAVDSVGDRMRNKIWVGTLGTQTDGWSDELRADVEKRLGEERDSVPVWVADDVFKGCYDEFCHQVLWPCLHYAVPDAPKTKLFYESASYAQYLAVNKLFAARIASLYREGDIIWVNDYHLLLLPSLLRLYLNPNSTHTSIPPSFPSSFTNPHSIQPSPHSLTPSTSTHAPIGFFLHVAFPSSEIFRCLSMRAELLRGMLGADLVGFQTGSYARHWRQTVSRILSFEALPRGIQIPEGEVVAMGGLERGGGARSTSANGNKTSHQHRHHHHHHHNKTKGTGGSGGAGEDSANANTGEDVRDGVVERGRLVDVGVFPMGIDVRQLHIKRRDPEVAEWVSILRQRYAGYKLIVGRDKLDEIQGVKQKLQAFEVFLSNYTCAGVAPGSSEGSAQGQTTGRTSSSRTAASPNPSHPPASPSHTLANNGINNALPSPHISTSTNPPRLSTPIILIQIALPTSTANEAAASHLITTLISRINARFSTLTYTPIVFLRMEELTMGMYLALLEVADVFCVMSLREGMCLRSHEFVECQGGKVGGGQHGQQHAPHSQSHQQTHSNLSQHEQEQDPEPKPEHQEPQKPGVLILSEFTGSYSYSGFRSCIAVNPWDARGTARAMYDALVMGSEEAGGRWEDLHNHVTTQTAQTFVNSFLNRVVRANTEHQHNAVGLLGDGEGGGEGGMGEGGDTEGGTVGPVLLRAPANTPTNTNTNVSVLVNRFRHSHKRIILVDFEGTLWRRDLRKEAVLRLGSVYGVGVDDQSDSTSNTNPLPDEVERALVLLERLAEDRRNEVWLLSGLKVEGVLERVASRVPRVGIVAENGCFIKTRAVNGNGSMGDWYNMVAGINMTWKSACLEILNYFTERTPGSFIEEREASMVWRYWTSPTTATSTSTSTSSAVEEQAGFAASTSSLSSDTSSVSSASSTGTEGTNTEANTEVNTSANTNTTNPDRQWAQRQAAEAQNHIFDSLGERYGLRIIPGRNSFLVLPTNVSRSSAVGEILRPGGVVRLGGGGVGGISGNGGGAGGHAMSPSVSDAFVSPSANGGARSPPRILTTARPHPYSHHHHHVLHNHHPPPPSSSSTHAGSSSLSLSHSLSGSHAHGGHAHGHQDDAEVDFLLAVSSDEQLLRRLNEFDGAETVSTSGKGTDAKWRLGAGSEECGGVLGCFVGV